MISTRKDTDGLGMAELAFKQSSLGLHAERRTTVEGRTTHRQCTVRSGTLETDIGFRSEEDDTR